MISKLKVQSTKKMMEAGLDNETIAKLLNIKESTVERYLREGKKPKSKANILLFDIETLPMEVYVWGLYKQRIPIDNIIKEWCIVSWAAKWLFDSEVMSMTISGQDAIDRNDSSILKKIWDLFETADVIIAHNGMRFDVRKINARWKLAGYGPPSPYRVIDTLKVAQKEFAFSSHKLDYLVKILNDTQKLKTEYSLWKKCCVGDEKAIAYMEEYNRNDVLILEDLFLSLRGWIKSSPNLGLYGAVDTEICPTCGSSDIYWKGKYYTTVGRFNSGRCNNCGGIFRSRYSDLTKKEKLTLLSPVSN